MLALLMRCCSITIHSQPILPPAVAAAGKAFMSARFNKFKEVHKRTSAGSAGSTAVRSTAQDQQRQQQAVTAQLPRVIIITGPTAVGKTKLGLELAKRIGGEIISADSVQVYRGLDVGSDKLPEAQRDGVPHHLIDILEPTEEFSAGDFHQLGRQAAEDIIARGKVPIVAGGTGFYLRWFIFGKPTTPPSSPEAAARALELIGQAWQQAAAQVADGQQERQSQQHQQLLQNTEVCEQRLQQAQPPPHQHQLLEPPQQLQDRQDNLQAQQEVPQPPAAGQPATKAGLDSTSSACSQHSPQHSGPPHHATPGSVVQQWQQDSKQQQLPEGGPSSTPAQAPPQQQGVSSLPPVVAEAAAAALQLSEEQRWDVAVDVVQQLGDSQTAARIRTERNNWYRLQRVVQILLQNGGKPLSELDIDTTKDLEYDFRCFFLHRPRLELFDRIIQRVEEMVAGGLLSEALALLDQGLTANSTVSTRAIGYRQALEFMQAAIAKGSASREDLEQLMFDIATASRNLVKNQTTWFRDDGMFRWVDVSGRSTEDVLQDVLAELDKPQHEGGCGDSGRFDKATQAALKRYVPTLRIFNDASKADEVLAWVAEVAAARGSTAGTGGPQAAAASPVAS